MKEPRESTDDFNPTQIALNALRKEWITPYAEALVTFAEHDEACAAALSEEYDTSVCEVCRLLKRAEDEGWRHG